MVHPADESLIGRAIGGRYLIESLIGSGGMGAVYRARQVGIDRPVAVKILHRELAADAALVARFKREAKAASLLDHPSSVRVLDFGQDIDGLCYLVMDLVEGMSLFHVLRSEWPLTRYRIVELLRQTLGVLAAAHDGGIVHRDLKPENVIVQLGIDESGRAVETVKVCDFGMAKISETRTDVSRSGLEALTSHGVVVGTPEYMSPEQGRGEPLDGRADLYAVGVILYQLLCGQVPFSAPTPVGVLLKHLVEEPLPPSKIVPGVDPGLEAIALKAMSKRREDRYSDARAMRAELQAALDVEQLPIVHDSRHVTVRTRARAAPEADTLTAIDAVSDGAAVRVESARESSAPPPPPRRSMLPLVAGVLAAAAGVGAYALLARYPGALAFMSAGPQPVPSSSPNPSPAPSSAPVTTSSAIASASATTVKTTTTSSTPRATPTKATTPTSVPAATVTEIESAPSRPPQADELLLPAPRQADTTPGAAPPANAAAHAQVALAGARSEHASAADILGAMPVARLTQCYRDTFGGQGTVPGGTATLQLQVDGDGVVSQASFAAEESIAGAGRCIAHAALGVRIGGWKGAETGRAEVDLVLAPR